MSTTVETCERCGRTYPDAYAYAEHSCVNLDDLHMSPECHEEVVRRGMAVPCELPAVAVRIDPNWGGPYPVCKRHTRGGMVPLVTIVQWAMQR